MTAPEIRHGGRRKGAGRKPMLSGEARSAVFMIRLTPAERALILARGGADYIRRLIAGDTRGEDR